MKISPGFIGLAALLMAISLASCVPESSRPAAPVAGKGSPLASETRKMVADICEKQGLEGIAVQVGPNHFWEKGTQVNLPFSGELSDALAAELSRAGAVVTLQETGEHPLKVTGTYAKAGDRLMITVKLRQMGDTASRDLAVVRGTVPLQSLDPAWLAPRFDRISRTLVRKLEADYSGMRALKVAVQPFTQGSRSGPELVLGKEMQKFMAQALASSYTFQSAGTAVDTAEAVLKGDYTRMGDQMMFHAAIEDLQTGQPHAGATFAVPAAQIPNELLLPDIQSLDGAVQALAHQLMAAYAPAPGSSGMPEVVFVTPYSFHDDTHAAIVPLSRLLAEKFKQVLSKDGRLSVTDNPAVPAGLMLSGKIWQKNSGILISAGLDRVTAMDGQVSVTHLATRQVSIDTQYCDPSWLAVTLAGKTGFLMKELEHKSRLFLPDNRRSDIAVTRFQYKETRLYSEFSDLLNHQILDYLSTSRFYSPVTDPEARMARYKEKGVRAIVPTEKTEATQAALLEAPYYVAGSFSPDTGNDLAIHATLAGVDGRILSSAAVTVPARLIDMTRVTPVQDTAFEQDLDTVSDPGDQGLAIELMTQKGRHNVSFSRGEEITFFVKANKDVYVNIFTADADRQIFRIYPNAFSSPHPKISAGRVTAIPDNTYANEFAFQVQGKTGNEMVFAVASDQPLPDIPGSTDTGFFGMRQMGSDIQQIKAFLSEYAGQRGMFLSWDAMQIVTK